MQATLKPADLPEQALAAAPGPEEAWTAVLRRDRRYRERFLYGVRTTGVFCRPGCASRLPRRENVRFFATAAEAESAGFRACKRCRPDGARLPAAQRSVERARRYLDAHLDESVSLARLAGVAHVSAHHLQRTFKRTFGLSPREYVAARRAERLRERLRAGDTVSRAGFEAGYGSASRVYEPGGAELGMTPATYRKGGQGTTIRYATAGTRFGRILVAATSRGVCAVELGDEDGALEAALRKEFPRARIEPGDDALDRWVQAVVAYLDGVAGELPLPLDVEASAFQLRVWKALQEIPRGATASYGQVAAAIGAPASARAVARACASNRLALVVPCHRVVRGDGELGGYRWGVERKRRLLELESPA